MDPHQIATSLADALDADDYQRAESLLAQDCVYDSPDGQLCGADAIVESYQQHSDRARERFDQVRYESRVEQTGSHEYRIVYSDHLKKGEHEHTFMCAQRVRIGQGGRVVSICHEEISGERKRLGGFLERCGVTLE